MPGLYQVRLKVGAKTLTQSFEIRKDPRVATTDLEFKEQFDFLIKIRDKVSEAHEAVNTIRDIRKQTDDLVKRMDKHPSKDSVANSAKRMNDKLKKIEEEIIQVKIKSGQDALNYPIKLNDKIASISGVVASADTRPTAQARKAYDELTEKLDAQLSAYKRIIGEDFANFNATVKSLDVPAVILKPAGGK
jgi:alanyl-tRNA synthetase